MSRPIRKPTIKKLNIRRADQRADNRQQQHVAADLHVIVDRITNAWPFIQKQASEYGRGWKTNTLGDGRGTGEDTVVESQALNQATEDPGWWAEQIIGNWQRLITEAHRVDDLLTRLIPMSREEWEKKHRGRQSSVEVCALCNEPIPDGEVKRIDNLPHHKNTCYFKVWRQRQSA